MYFLAVNKSKHIWSAAESRLAVNILLDRWSAKANASGFKKFVGKTNADQQVDEEGLCLGPRKDGRQKSSLSDSLSGKIVGRERSICRQR
jgi:hypothetical protein